MDAPLHYKMVETTYLMKNEEIKMASLLAVQSLFSMKISPQLGIGRGRERDGNTMRDGCGKGAGKVREGIPNTRIPDFLNDIFIWRKD